MLQGPLLTSVRLLLFDNTVTLGGATLFLVFGLIYLYESIAEFKDPVALGLLPVPDIGALSSSLLPPSAVVSASSSAASAATAGIPNTALAAAGSKVAAAARAVYAGRARGIELTAH